MNAIGLGWIVTLMTANALDNDPDRKAKVFGRTPAGRIGQPGEVATAAVFVSLRGGILRLRSMPYC